jgi:hypothetical protein
MNLVIWAMFGMLLIVVMGVVGNSGSTGTANIEFQFDRLGCPMPAQSGLWNSSGTIMYTNSTYNWQNGGGGAGAVPPATLTCTEVHTTEGIDYKNGSPLVAIGVFYYVGDYVSELLANKVVAVFTIISYFLTPINFDFFGFTIADLNGPALMVIIGIYIFAYLPIGIFLYKTISPFAGYG